MINVCVTIAAPESVIKVCVTVATPGSVIKECVIIATTESVRTVYVTIAGNCNAQFWSFVMYERPILDDDVKNRRISKRKTTYKEL